MTSSRLLLASLILLIIFIGSFLINFCQVSYSSTCYKSLDFAQILVAILFVTSFFGALLRFRKEKEKGHRFLKKLFKVLLYLVISLVLLIILFIVLFLV